MWNPLKKKWEICEHCEKGIHYWCTGVLKGGTECACGNDLCRELRLDMDSTDNPNR